MKSKVYYNDKCSICRIEINHYKKKCNSLEWVDINTPDNYLDKNLINKNKFLRRIHIKTDNNILVGVDAFIFLWSKIPQYKILSKFISLPIIYQIAYVCYEILAFLLYIKNFKQFKI